MTTKTEAIHPGEFILSEAEGYRSRENVTVLSGQNLVAGAVIGKATVALTVAEPGHTGTGDGAITMDVTTPVLAGAQVGTYTATCTHVDTAGGMFTVLDPNGICIGNVRVGDTFANQIKFVIADGSTDHAAGSKFTIVVTAGTGKVRALPKALDSLDGTSKPYGVLVAPVDASGGDKPGVAIVRDAEVQSSLLTYDTTSISTLCNTQLGTLGVIAR